MFEMNAMWDWIDKHLLHLVIVITAIGLWLPGAGNYLAPTVSPLLAMLMLVISLTFDWQAVREALRKPSHLFIAVFLVFGPMSLIGWSIGRVFYGDSLLFAGQTLVGALPTDVSAPLLILLAHGNVALGAVMNTVVTGISPFILPPLFLWLTDITLDVPVLRLMLELASIILIPMVLGVSLRSRYTTFFKRYDTAYSGISGILYLLLLLTVVSDGAETILGLGATVLILILSQFLLNVSGYILAGLLYPWIQRRDDQVAFLFTVSKKEFSIAAAVVATSGLPEAVVIPAVFYAVIQMITSPLAVQILNRYWPAAIDRDNVSN